MLSDNIFEIEKDIFGDNIFSDKNRAKKQEFLQDILKKGFDTAKELSEETYAGTYQLPAVLLPVEYSYRPHKRNKRFLLAYDMVSRSIGRTPPSLILLMPNALSDLVIIDDFYIKRTIFGRQYSAFIRKSPDPENTKTMLGSIRQITQRLEHLEKKLESYEHYHSTGIIKPGFFDGLIKTPCIPVSTDAFYQLGVAEMLLVDHALFGKIGCIEDLAQINLGRRYEVYLKKN